MTQKEIKQKVSELTAEWNALLIKITAQQLGDIQLSTFLSNTSMYFKNRFDSLILTAASNQYQETVKEFKPKENLKAVPKEDEHGN